MCHACVIESVRDRMLSRRDVLRGSAGVAAAGALGALASAPVRAAGGPVDCTHELHERFPTYFGEPGFAMQRVFGFAENGFNLFELSVNEHTGTHIDAPLHFSADGASVAEIPVRDLVCPLCVVDIRAKAAEDDDAQVTPEDLKAWTDANGEFPDGACVAMLSGWGEYVDGERFRNVRGEGDAAGMHFPGFHADAAQMLLEHGSIAGIAVDTLSLDHGPSADFAVHYAWLPTGRWGIECLANLEALPAAGATLVVGAPKHRGGSGGPARVIALV